MIRQEGGRRMGLGEGAARAGVSGKTPPGRLRFAQRKAGWGAFGALRGAGACCVAAPLFKGQTKEAA